MQRVGWRDGGCVRSGVLPLDGDDQVDAGGQRPMKEPADLIALSGGERQVAADAAEAARALHNLVLHVVEQDEQLTLARSHDLLAHLEEVLAQLIDRVRPSVHATLAERLGGLQLTLDDRQLRAQRVQQRVQLRARARQLAEAHDQLTAAAAAARRRGRHRAGGGGERRW